MLETDDSGTHEAIEAAILSLESRAKLSRVEGITFLVVAFIVATALVFYFGTFAVSERVVTINADMANLPNALINVDQNANWQDVVADSVLRIGAVLLAIFLIQILVSFSRHRYRTSDALSARALSLRLSGNDPEKFSEFCTNISTEFIEFGSFPKHPYGEALQTISELTKKIPKP